IAPALVLDLEARKWWSAPAFEVHTEEVECGRLVRFEQLARFLFPQQRQRNALVDAPRLAPCVGKARAIGRRIQCEQKCLLLIDELLPLPRQGHDDGGPTSVERILTLA